MPQIKIKYEIFVLLKSRRYRISVDGKLRPACPILQCLSKRFTRTCNACMCVLFVNCKLACNFVHTKTLNYFLLLCVSAWVIIKIVNKVLRGAIVAWRGNFVLKGQFYEKSSWAEKVSQTFLSNEFKDFFYSERERERKGERIKKREKEREREREGKREREREREGEKKKEEERERDLKNMNFHF